MNGGADNTILMLNPALSTESNRAWFLDAQAQNYNDLCEQHMHRQQQHIHHLVDHAAYGCSAQNKVTQESIPSCRGC